MSVKNGTAQDLFKRYEMTQENESLPKLLTFDDAVKLLDKYTQFMQECFDLHYREWAIPENHPKTFKEWLDINKEWLDIKQQEHTYDFKVPKWIEEILDKIN